MIGSATNLALLLWQLSAAVSTPGLQWYLTSLGKAVAVFNIIVPTIIAIWMWRGANWARMLFFALYAPATVVLAIWIAAAENDMLVLRKVVVLIVYCVVLRRPSATEFFTGKSIFSRSGDGVYHEPEPRRSSRSRSSRAANEILPRSSSRSRRRYDY
ncbi:MAG: hypothetical protein QM796_03090 [Chthoniobacteraceae bacterium]